MGKDTGVTISVRKENISEVGTSVVTLRILRMRGIFKRNPPEVSCREKSKDNQMNVG